MAQFVHIPTERVAPETLQALLEEFASRDGTEYGEHDVPLETKVASLRRQLAAK